MKRDDEQRSPELSAALRDITPSPPIDEVNWGALHGRIAMRAAPLLRQRGELRVNVWQTLSGWGRRGIPLTLAAAAAVLLALGLGVQRQSAAAYVSEEELLSAGLSAESTLLATTSDDELLDALLFGEEGNR